MVMGMSVDNGPGYAPSSMTNILFAWRVFLDAELYLLLGKSNCAGWSTLHAKIEQQWATANRALAGKSSSKNCQTLR